MGRLGCGEEMQANPQLWAEPGTAVEREQNQICGLEILELSIL